MNKKRFLFIYTKMIVGGSTTSLLSILNNFDYSKYDVYLLLLESNGDLQHLINPNVKIITANPVNKWKRLMSPVAMCRAIKAEVVSKIYKNKLLKSQINSYDIARFMEPLKDTFDVGVSFLEFWPQRYLAHKVKVKKKISWIHIDPKEAGLRAKYSEKSLSLVDRIVLVSNSCKSNFDMMFPALCNKSLVIENILDSSIIKGLSDEKCDLHTDKNAINLVSVCRINNASKALDRVVSAFVKLQRKGYSFDGKLNWYIIGDGPDYNNLKASIESNGLGNVFLLGKQLNPYKYEKLMHYFMLPSRYEGKPMAVTEAQMLGLVPIVCEYSSASEQINNGIDGIIVNNTDDAILEPIKKILDGKIQYEEMKRQVLSNNYSNLYVMDQIYNVINDKL